MKKLSLLLASAMLASVSAFAQTKPAAPAYTSFDDVYEDYDNAYYLYNVEAGLFLCAGNDWGTRASLATKGNTIVSYEDLTLGKAEVAGVPWYLGEGNSKEDGVSCYYFENRSGNGNVYNTSDDWNENGECTGIWVDGGSSRPWDGWYVEKLDGNTFKLSAYTSVTADNVTTWGEKSKYWYGAQKLAEGDTRTYIMDGANTTWAFVSKAEFDKIQPKLNLYYVQVGLADIIAKGKALNLSVPAEYEALVNNAEADRADVIAAINDISPRILLGEALKAAKEVDPSYNYAKFESIFNGAESTEAQLNEATTLLKAITSLKKAINAAQAKYPSLDYSEPIAVYNNLEATLEEVQKAEAKVQEIITTFEQSQATLEKPADVSSAIQHISDNLSATNFAAWTSTNTSGSFQLNTWSNEGNSDGTNMITPFIEYWRSKDDKAPLGDAKYYRDQEKNPFTVLPGAYRIFANIRIYNESGAEYMTGAYLFGNANRTNLVNPEIEGPTNALEGAVYGEYNSMLYYWKDSFETYTIVPADGILKFGLQTESANFNWVAAKGWKVEYLGDAYDALDHVRKNSELVTPEIAEETIVTKQLIADFNAAKASYANSTSAEEILSAYGTLLPLADELPANIAAWKAYDDAVFAAKEHDVLVNGSGEYVDLLEEYVNGKSAPSEDYPNGTYGYIIEQLSLSTAEVEAETKFLADLLDNAIKTSMVPGQDVSDMLKNPKFAEGFTGWTNNTTGSNKGTAGGLKAYPCVETYDATIDVYQIVENVPDGIYSLSCRAFERPAGNQNEKTPTGTYLYMNDFKTPVQNIIAGGLPIDKAINYENSFIEGSVNEDYTSTGGTTNNDVIVKNSDDDELYVPNGMSGASYAFRAGRYEQKVYGIIEGGTMKIGLTSNGKQVEWTLWADFILTYEGKTEESISNLIDNLCDRADEYMGENEDYITNPAYDALDKAIAAASKAQDEGDVDVMWDALLALNKALDAAQENVAAVTALKAAIEELENASNEAENPSSAALDAYDEIQPRVEEDAIMNLTTEEVKALTEDVKKVAALLKLNGDYENATDEEPADMTSSIANADMEQNGGNGATDVPGWSYKVANVDRNAPKCKDPGINGKSSEVWGSNPANIEFNFYQTLTALPAGTYELSATAFSAQVTTEDKGGRVVLYAETSGGEISSTPLDIYPNKGTGLTDGDFDSESNIMASAKPYSVIFTVKDDEDVTIGFQSVGTLSTRWFMCDDFHLDYFGPKSSKEVTGDKGLVDIDGIDAESAAISAIYTITGAKVSSLQKGINIVKYADGKVAKVLVK